MISPIDSTPRDVHHPINLQSRASPFLRERLQLLQLHRSPAHHRGKTRLIHYELHCFCPKGVVQRDCHPRMGEDCLRVDASATMFDAII